MKNFKKYTFIIILCFSCSNAKQNIELRNEVNDKLDIIEKGARINNQREGYWITLSKEGVITIENFYVHGKLNGPIKFFDDDGTLMSEGYMENDSSNGLWKYYHENGKLRSMGVLKNDERTGIWESYASNGKLDRKILYENHTTKVLIDNHLTLRPPPPISSSSTDSSKAK